MNRRGREGAPARPVSEESKGFFDFQPSLDQLKMGTLSSAGRKGVIGRRAGKVRGLAGGEGSWRP